MKPQLQDVPYQLGYDCWYVSMHPDRRDWGGKYRDTALNIAAMLREKCAGDLEACEYIEFSSKHTPVELRWYPRDHMWSWDYWSEGGYTTPSEHEFGVYNER